MVHRLFENNSLLNQFVAEIRDVNVQNDRLRFRRNLERIGQICGYELSKQLNYATETVVTPLGEAPCNLISDNLVLCTILRAGLPMHQGLLSFFDKADNAFVSAYRRHHKDGTFEIKMQYITCPDLEGKVLIVSDPMLATGASLGQALEALEEYGKPSQIHVVVAIASSIGISYMRRRHPNVHLWIGAEDEELTAKSYIVPGLGDAGDLAYGEKLQD